jgi:hypothetical protein
MERVDKISLSTFPARLAAMNVSASAQNPILHSSSPGAKLRAQEVFNKRKGTDYSSQTFTRLAFAALCPRFEIGLYLAVRSFAQFGK